MTVSLDTIWKIPFYPNLPLGIDLTPNGKNDQTRLKVCIWTIMTISWIHITCFNCGSQFKTLTGNSELTGECYKCCTVRMDEERKTLDSAFEAPPKQYRYFLTWTKKPDVHFDVVQRNFARFLDRTDTLKISRLWYVEEHLESNAHIHCYIETARTFPRSRVRHYETAGKIDKQKAKGSLEEIEDYMSKENELKKYLG